MDSSNMIIKRSHDAFSLEAMQTSMVFEVVLKLE